MALTRKLLKGMGLTEEQIDSVIDAHTETVDGLKSQINQYKADAEKLPSVQKELDDLKAGTDWKAEHDKLKKQFDDYKADISGKETLGKIKAAYRKLLEDQKIATADADLIMAATKFDDMKLNESGALTDSENLTNKIKETYARYIPTVDTKGANVNNPPSNPNNNGANPKAAEIAKQFYERRYGKLPTNDSGSDKNKTE